MELVDSAAPAAPSPDTPAPKTEEPPAPPAPDAAPEAPKNEAPLFETPDGRKVTAEVLTKEWKENFLPEFTRKSQRLAEFESKKDIPTPPKEQPKWKQADYTPETYAEVIELAKAEALAEMKAEAQRVADEAAGKSAAEIARAAEVKAAVEAELATIRTSDPKLVEKELFDHANKYGFTNLKAAHANMVDMRKAIVATEQRTVKNVKNREEDPIAGNPGGADAPDDGYDPEGMSQYQSANDFLAKLKGGK